MFRSAAQLIKGLFCLTRLVLSWPRPKCYLSSRLGTRMDSTEWTASREELVQKAEWSGVRGVF